MATVQKYIYEENDKITAVRKIVRMKVAQFVDDTPTQSPLASDDWRGKAFSCPERTVRIGTLFSVCG